MAVSVGSSLESVITGEDRRGAALSTRWVSSAWTNEEEAEEADVVAFYLVTLFSAKLADEPAITVSSQS